MQIVENNVQMWLPTPGQTSDFELCSNQFQSISDILA